MAAQDWPQTRGAPKTVIAQERSVAATNAYKGGDAQQSIDVHNSTPVLALPEAEEKHGGSGSEFVKSMVFGGLDGVVTTFSLVASVAGGGLPIEAVLSLGFANLIADGISMGLGDYISSKAEYNFMVNELARSSKMVREGKTKEVVDALVKKGMRGEDAAEVVGIITGKPEYRAFAEEFVLVEEMGQEPPGDPWGPAKAGVVMFVSFIAFGSIPMWIYVITFGAKYTDPNGIFGIAAFSCAISLFILGWMQAVVTSQNKLKTGVSMMINGSMASAAAYLIGWGISSAIGNGTECEA